MKTIPKIIFMSVFLALTFLASKGFCGGGGQIVIDQNWITTRSTTLCWDKKPQDSCYSESKSCRDDFEKGLTDLLNKTCPIQGGDWWCDPDPTKDLAKLLSYVDNFKQTSSFLKALKACNPPPGVCGDKILNGNDECDDGNAQDGDGCSNKCTIEVPANVDSSCYQGFLNGSCAQKKQACDLIQGDKNCPEQLNQCLQGALKSCQKSAPATTASAAPAAQNTSSPSAGATSCSISPLGLSPNGSLSLAVLMWIVPFILRRRRKI